MSMAQIEFNDYCKECGICAAFCPGEVFDFTPGNRPIVVRPEKCVVCLQCTMRCPDFAIHVKGDEK